MVRPALLTVALFLLTALLVPACESSSDSSASGPSAACVEEPWDCSCESSTDCPGDWVCTYGKCYEPGCHYDCICGPLDCAEADHYGYSCSDCDEDIFEPDIKPDMSQFPEDGGDTSGDVSLEVGPTGPEPCSPEAQGLDGTPVEYSVSDESWWELYEGCTWAMDDLIDDESGPQVMIAQSAEEFDALVTCEGDKPQNPFDDSQSRMVIIRGLAEIAPRSPTWVLEIDGVLWVDLTTELYSSGIELLAEPYGHALTIDAGDSPVQLQECVIPYDGREVP